MSRYFSVGFGRYFSVLPIPIPENISVRTFGIKILAGAPQKIGGSPLFPKKGGLRPPFCNFALLLKKKREFFKKRVPAKSSKDVPAKTYSTKIPTENTESPANLTAEYRYRKNCWYNTVVSTYIILSLWFYHTLRRNHTMVGYPAQPRESK